MALRLVKKGLNVYRDQGTVKLIKEALGLFARKTFHIWEKTGLHITPVHYYQPIPNTQELGDHVWENHSSLSGIDIDEEGQLELLSEFKNKYEKEYNSFPRCKYRSTDDFEYYIDNDYFESVDGEILYSMIRRFSPDRIIEIGGGFSTRLIQQALQKNDGNCTHIVIDPYPNDTLRSNFQGRIIQKEVQDVPVSEFKSLSKNDILFIDSSHVLKIGSDVKYEYLEILPRLNDGVLVHCHDIFLPTEYPKEWIMDNRYFWNEQYLLQAFLAFNDAYDVLWAGSYMHINNPGRLNEYFNSYNSDQYHPKSFWMKKAE